MNNLAERAERGRSPFSTNDEQPIADQVKVGGRDHGIRIKRPSPHGEPK